MKTARYILLFAFIFNGQAVLADERVDQRVDAPADGTVSVENVAGSITVSGWDHNEVRVEGELDERVERLEFVNEGNFTRVKVIYPRNRSGSIRGSHLNISVPAGSRLEVSGVSSEVDVRGVSGPVRAETVSGDVSVDGSTGDYLLESVSGNIRLQGGGLTARVRASSVSGDVRLGDVKGEIEITSISGNVYVNNGSFTRIEAGNTSGDIDIAGEFANDGVFRFKSISGDVAVRFQSKPAGTFDITTFSGGIDNDFGPEPERTGRYSPGMELKFREGDATAEFRMNTLSGDISLQAE